ncbi:hypothetical protein Mapa_011969 [Marchantia paleacea]|nr:hypothetical protein Mapa_011969 [Marchantia paleacea]
MSTHYGSSAISGALQFPETSQPSISPISANSKIPWGWHFRPTGAELITNLNKKVKRQRQDRSRYEPEDISDVLREIDLSQVEPWEIKGIPETCSIRATHADELNQYFYTQKEQKYRHGKRSNRATRRGFWKATGRDKPIYGKINQKDRHKRVIGYRKALVFYEGRAPNGNKTDWILHEYRLEADPDSTVRDEQWVACHMFIKERNIPPRDVADVSDLPNGALEMGQDWPELPPLTVKEEPGFPYSDHRTVTQEQQQELSFHLPPCVRDDLSLPRLEEDDNNYSVHREVSADVVVIPRPETGRLPSFDNDRLIADLLYSYAENPQQSIWANLEGSVISDTLWNPTY